MVVYRAEVEDKLVAGQERRRELESKVMELEGCKEQLEEELVTLNEETSSRVRAYTSWGNQSVL